MHLDSAHTKPYTPKGAIGTMKTMPKTIKSLVVRARRSCCLYPKSCSDIAAVYSNIACTARPVFRTINHERGPSTYHPPTASGLGSQFCSRGSNPAGRVVGIRRVRFVGRAARCDVDGRRCGPVGF